MLVEAAVLDRQHGLGQIGRHLADRHEFADPGAARRDHLAADIEDRDRGRALDAEELVGRRQARGVIADQHGEGENAKRGGGEQKLEDAPAPAAAALGRGRAAALARALRRPAGRLAALTPGRFAAQRAVLGRTHVPFRILNEAFTVFS